MNKIFVILAVWLLALSGCTLGEKDEKVKRLDCGIYIKIISWGLTGDNKRTYISETPNLNDTIGEPYFRSLDFFYKVENCTIIIYKADSLNRAHLLSSTIKLDQRFSKEINYSNYDSLNYRNVLYD
jgi:hypothetical protein